jgi:hypothetical protein
VNIINVPSCMASGEPPLPVWKNLHLFAFMQFRNFSCGAVFNRTYRDELNIRWPRLVYLWLHDLLRCADILSQHIISCYLPLIPSCRFMFSDSDLRLSRDTKSETPALTYRWFSGVSTRPNCRPFLELFLSFTVSPNITILLLIPSVSMHSHLIIRL